MAKLIGKLKDDSGETLVEGVVSFLLILMVIAALGTMIVFGFGLTTQSEILDKTDTSLQGTVTISYQDTGYTTTYDAGE